MKTVVIMGSEHKQSILNAIRELAEKKLPEYEAKKYS